MGKRGKEKRKQQKAQRAACPSFEWPVCPACGYADRLVEEGQTDDPLYECTRCWVRFMLEDSSVELEEEDDDATAAANVNSGWVPLKCAICMGRGCEVCGGGRAGKAKKKKPEGMTEPEFGDCEELTNVPSVASRS